jgi:hypothetical protein
MKKLISGVILLTVAVFLISGCTPKARYDNILKRELAKGTRNDTLFLGLYFGMPEKEFYTHCWNLNKKGLIRQGEFNTTVRYEVKKDLKFPANMDFYPHFKDGKIFEVPVRFLYQGWAPWNKNLSSGELQKYVLKCYKKTYGRKFLKVVHPTHGAAYVNVNGNRRITIFREDEMHVWAVFTDLTVKKELNDLNPALGNDDKHEK